MNEIENQVLTYLINLLNPQLLKTASLEIQENKGLYNSVLIKVENNPYRNGVANKFLFARIRSSGKQPYISFNSRYTKLQAVFANDIYSIASEPTFIRIDLNAFLEYPDSATLSKVLNEIFLSSFSFPTFGCCSRYKECSNEHQCVHPDLLYATACMHRKIIEKEES